MGIVCNFVSGLPFKPGVFELVLSMRLFHHLHEPEERRSVLREFSRAAAGWVILSYYQANALHRLQRVLRRAVKRSRTRIRMINRREFQKEVRGAGFEIVRIFPLFRGIHGHHIALLKKD
jgi:SAM-dependent methyltransferase